MYTVCMCTYACALYVCFVSMEVRGELNPFSASSMSSLHPCEGNSYFRIFSSVRGQSRTKTKASVYPLLLAKPTLLTIHLLQAPSILLTGPPQPKVCRFYGVMRNSRDACQFSAVQACFGHASGMRDEWSHLGRGKAPPLRAGCASHPTP